MLESLETGCWVGMAGVVVMGFVLVILPNRREYETRMKL